MSRRCDPWAIALFALAASACTITNDPMLRPTDGGPDAGADAPSDAPRPDVGFVCAPGGPGCFGNVHYTCGDDGRTRHDEVDCAEACDPELGCVTCVPGSRRCDGDVSWVCLEDGSAWTYGRDCSDWGSACGDEGYCEDACAASERVRSYVGCEYWPSPLANYPGLDDAGFDFRVVVANPGRATAEVTITRAGRFVARDSVPPGAAIDIVLPWIDEVSFAFADDVTASRVVADGAYRMVSDQPILVSQFNPFHYATARAHSYSNDASLLLPSHVLGTEHVGLSYMPWSVSSLGTSRSMPGYLALVGVAPGGTDVTVTLSADVAPDATGRWGAARAGETISFSLDRGEIAQIIPAPPPPCDATRPGFIPIPDSEGGGWCREPEHDLTGSRVVSTEPLEAFGGHMCANVPVDIPACDHLETSLAPVGTWGTRFATVPLRDPTTASPNVLRIVAAHDGTTITATPPVRGIEAGLVLDAGEYVDGWLEGPTSLVASRPVQIGQILVGQNIETPPLERGDPGLTILVPEEQFRSEYVFVTPTSYTGVVGGQSWVVVSREPGVAVTLDGAVIDAPWVRVGEREIATVPVAGGAHRATAGSIFGLIAFGLGEYTSYAYPAGLDLNTVPF